jgi:hypothetical protein
LKNTLIKILAIIYAIFAAGVNKKQITKIKKLIQEKDGLL